MVSVPCSLISTGGLEEEDVYPADINMQLTWHDVEPGALIRHEHDAFMLERWGAT
jgi:hypothetical protein